MSKVSLKNELLPSFEPIEQQNTSSPKRKRSLRDPVPSINNEQDVSHKRPRAKKNSSGTITVWIGATLMQDKDASCSSIAAYCVYYGLNDGRNFTEKVTIKQNQDLDHVYIMGAIRALEKCEDDSIALCIYTGSRVLQTATGQDKQDNSAICNEIKQKIAKRKGNTSISYRSRTAASNEYQVAHKMATEKLHELEQTREDTMDIDEEQAEVLESLEVTNVEMKEVLVAETTTIEETKVEKDDGSRIVEKKVVDTTVITKETTIEQDAPIEVVAAPSWASTLNLRNLLDILKAPFTRKS